MSIADKELKSLGDVLVGKYWYDFNSTYDRFDFLKLRFKEKRETIKRFNKVVYGKK